MVKWIKRFDLSVAASTFFSHKFPDVDIDSRGGSTPYNEGLYSIRALSLDAKLSINGAFHLYPKVGSQVSPGMSHKIRHPTRKVGRIHNPQM